MPDQRYRYYQIIQPPECSMEISANFQTSNTLENPRETLSLSPIVLASNGGGFGRNKVQRNQNSEHFLNTPARTKDGTTRLQVHECKTETST